LPTATNNLDVWCRANGREDLLGEWAHPDKAPQDFLRASGVKVPWECGKCGWGWETMAGRCRLTVSKPVLKVPMVSALEATI